MLLILSFLLSSIHQHLNRFRCCCGREGKWTDMNEEHTKEEVEQIIKPYEEDIRSVVFDAWAMWRESFHASHPLWNGTMGNDMCNFFLNVATRKFHSNSAHMKVHTKRPYVGIYVEGQLYMRFKMGKRSLRTSNYQTTSARAFHDKTMPIEALAGMTRLELVYVPSSDKLDLENIMIVCRDKDRIAWTIDLLARAQPEQTIIEFKPPQSPKPQETAAASVIKKKGGTDDRKQHSAGEGA